MATYYWVGGSGTWDATTTTNWATSSGGSGGAGVPTSADDVIFDAGSNIGTGSFTVTIAGTSASPSACRDFSTGGAGGALDGAMTLSFANATSVLAAYGSITLPVSNLSVTGVSGSLLRLLAAGSATLTTNGVSLSQVNNIGINGGGTITLGSALTAANLNPASGTLDTANYNMTLNQLITSGATAKTITLGSSAVTCSASTPIDFTNTTSFTFNAGTSTITCSSSSATLIGGGQTFYNVTFSSNAAGGGSTINGANTFNNLTQTSPASTGRRLLTLSADQTVQGTLTLGAANTAIRRIHVASDTIGTQRTITLNGTLAALADINFRDIKAAGTVATPWTGTRLGDGKNNSGITFAASKPVYWNLAGSQNWSATGWATTNNGVPDVNNFPLPQDTATFTEAGAAGTVTVDSAWWIGSIQMADGVSNRTTAFTLATGTSVPSIFGDVTFFSGLTLSGTGNTTFSGQGVTQTITSAGISWTQPLTVNSPTGTVKLADNLTNTNTTALTFTAGTLDINGNTLTCVAFSSSNSNTRTLAFGAGNITLTGNAATIWTTATSTGLTVTGTPVVNATYAGATGTRTINIGAAGEANAISVNVTAGTDTLSFGTTDGAYKNINYTGFSGSATIASSIICYGNFVTSSGMTFNSGVAVLSFRATSGTQTVTTAGKTMDFPFFISAAGAVVKFADALTQGSTRLFQLSAGTLEFAAGVTSTVGVFQTTGTSLKTLRSTLAGSQATLSQASGTVSASYTTIKDINATGGATWDALIDRGSIDAGNNAGWNFTTAGVTDILNRVFYRQILQPVLRG